MAQEQSEKSFADITASCAKVVSYYHLQNGISPIKRLYVKNSSDEERSGLRIRISSEPKFLLPHEITDVRIPRRTTAKFEESVSLSPLYMVALDKSEKERDNPRGVRRERRARGVPSVFRWSCSRSTNAITRRIPAVLPPSSGARRNSTNCSISRPRNCRGGT